ncbi:MAG TPA: zinc ribbon domain-containing protein [Pirellulales bacterium]|nr:zinc ribbon domain-containing protein [Pirellulales bacterium]
MSERLTKCSVCQALLDEEDLFCANCGTEAPTRADQHRDQARVATCNFECSGCGASMSYDASAGHLRCPFCGSEKLASRPDAKVLSPERVVPFSLRHDQASAKMRNWLGQGFWRPGDLSERALVVSMTAVYVPAWIFSAQTHTRWTADTSETPPGALAAWFPLYGEHRGSHAGLLVGASGALTPQETSEISPFDLSAGVKPEQVDLDNITVEQFSVGRRYARPLARQGLEALEAADCQQAYVPGRCRNMKVNLRLEGLASEPVLLPVWIMAYRYREGLFRFLVNGQTGKATGQAPISYRKIMAVIGIVLGAFAALLICAGLAAAVRR